MTLTRDIIGHAKCINAEGASHLTAGKVYRVTAWYDLEGVPFLNILCDIGTLYAYPESRFEMKEPT